MPAQQPRAPRELRDDVHRAARKPSNGAPGPAAVRFTYLHGDENFVDLQDPDTDAPTPAAQVAGTVTPELQARIGAWNGRMGDAFGYRRHGEGLPHESWPAPVRESLTREYDALLAELRAAGLPVLRDAWWAHELEGSEPRR